MKIEAGKYYRTRDGKKVGPMERDTYAGTEWPWTADNYIDRCRDDGTCSTYDQPDERPSDIVAEWTDEPTGPVITETVTRKRIKPGVYGRLHVSGTLGDRECVIGLLSRDKGPLPLDRGNFSIIEIRDLVTDLTAIADALEAGVQQ